MNRFPLINISTYQFLISIFVYIHCMFIKRVSEVVSVRVIQRLRCSTLSNKFLISRELISKYRKYDSTRILMSTCTHKKSIRQRLLATCWTTIMRKSSCDLKTNKRTRIKGEGPRRRLKILHPSAMTCLVLPQIHQGKPVFVRPKPGNIFFSVSLVVRVLTLKLIVASRGCVATRRSLQFETRP